MKLTQNILVPTDFSDAASLALDAANVVAMQNEAKITIVHVYTPRGVLLGGAPGLDDGATISQKDEEALHAKLREVREKHFPKVEHAKVAVLIAENPAEAIVEYSEREDVDMIVIATHGRSGLKRVLIGSVAERVVRHAPCPVLTLRSKLK